LLAKNLVIFKIYEFFLQFFQLDKTKRFIIVGDGQWSFPSTFRCR